MDVVLLGAGSQARLLLELMEAADIGPIAGIIDDDPALQGTKIEGIEVIGTMDKLHMLSRVHRIHRAVIAVGNNELRRKLAEVARAAGLRLPVVKHPSAVVARTAIIGEGTVIMAGSVVGSHTRIGELSIINTKASIDHDCMIGDGVHIASGATITGNVTIGNGVLVGAGVTIIQDICIGDEALIGAGSTVLHDVNSHTTVVGTPAHILPGRTGAASAPPTAMEV